MPILGAAVLILAVLAVYLFSRALCWIAGEPRASIAAALATALLGAIPVTICRLTEDLVAATLITAALAIAGTVFLWRRTPVAPPLELPRVRTDLWARALALVALVLVALAAIDNYLWDEYSGHFPVSAAIARGLAPPEHPFFPGEPFRYHYAYDALAGIVRAFTGMKIADALDVPTIATFALLLAVARDMGARLGGRPGANIAMTLAPWGSSFLAYLVQPELGGFTIHVAKIPAAWLQSVPPPVISNFFQHPQGLAMPLALAILLLFDERDARAGRRRLSRAALGALLLGLTSLAQVVFFLLLGLGLGTAVLARALRDRKWRLAAIELGFLAATLPIAYALGGFFAPAPAGSSPAEQLLSLGHSIFGEPVLTTVAHHLLLFGLPLLAVPLAIARLRKDPDPLHIALLAAAITGFTIPNVASYQRSWDIVKFFGVGAFFANLLLAGELARLHTRRAWFAVLFASSIAFGAFWTLRMSLLDGRAGIPKMQFEPPAAVADLVADRLGPLVKTRERVFSTNIDTAMAGGFLTPGFDWRTMGQGFMLDRNRADGLTLHYTRARHDLHLADLDALGVGFIVLSPGDISGLSAEGKAALEDPARFHHLFDATSDGSVRRVYRVVR